MFQLFLDFIITIGLERPTKKCFCHDGMSRHLNQNDRKIEGKTNFLLRPLYPYYKLNFLNLTFIETWLGYSKKKKKKKKKEKGNNL